MSTFSGLNRATTSLWTQRRAMDVTGQNIANVNTEGYSRQRAEMQAIGGSTVPAFYSTSTGIGGGVNADKVIRIRDAFLEGRGHTETANAARLTAVNETFELVEQAFREPGDTGIQSLMAEMWAGWGDVANQPQDPAARGQVIQRLNTLVGGIQFSQSQLGAQWDQTRENLGVLVADVNATAETVAQLNQAIQRALQSELPANDLLDKRDLLVTKLADQIGATVRLKDDGVVDVMVGGISLVAGSSAVALERHRLPRPGHRVARPAADRHRGRRLRRPPRWQGRGAAGRPQRRPPRLPRPAERPSPPASPPPSTDCTPPASTPRATPAPTSSARCPVR